MFMWQAFARPSARSHAPSPSHLLPPPPPNTHTTSAPAPRLCSSFLRSFWSFSEPKGSASPLSPSPSDELLEPKQEPTACHGAVRQLSYPRDTVPTTNPTTGSGPPAASVSKPDGSQQPHPDNPPPGHRPDAPDAHEPSPDPSAAPSPGPDAPLNADAEPVRPERPRTVKPLKPRPAPTPAPPSPAPPSHAPWLHKCLVLVLIAQCLWLTCDLFLTAAPAGDPRRVLREAAAARAALADLRGRAEQLQRRRLATGVHVVAALLGSPQASEALAACPNPQLTPSPASTTGDDAGTAPTPTHGPDAGTAAASPPADACALATHAHAYLHDAIAQWDAWQQPPPAAQGPAPPTPPSAAALIAAEVEAWDARVAALQAALRAQRLMQWLLGLALGAVAYLVVVWAAATATRYAAQAEGGRGAGPHWAAEVMRRLPFAAVIAAELAVSSEVRERGSRRG